MQPVHELNQDDTNILGHRNQHLPKILCLLMLVCVETNLRELGHAVHHGSHFRTKHPADIIHRSQGVLDGVVQKPGHHARLVEPKLGEQIRHLKRVHQVGLAALSRLTRMNFGRIEISF